ncbi:MAG: hypothetical protein PHI68_04110 [Candidatus Cloacimonetes bacterium]|nr:hypothetical protein [Candidatus Cloacimonadota bacterium]
MKHYVCLVFILLLNAFVFNAIHAQQLIYTEDFSATAPTGWVFASNTGRNWNSVLTNTYEHPSHSGSHLMGCYNHGDANASIWAFTQGFELTAGNSYYLDFYQRIYHAYYHENLKVTVGTAQTAASHSTVLMDLPGLLNTNYMNRVTSLFTPTSSGTYYFAFNNYNDPQQYANNYQAVDLVKVYEIVNTSVANPEDLYTSSGHPNILDLTWSPNDSNDPVMLAYNTSDTFGSPVDGSTYDASANSQIPGGGTVIYKGLAAAFRHNGLDPQSTYYYRAWSVNADIYSSGIGTSGTTPLIPSLTTDYFQGFDSQFLPDGWAHGNPDAHWDFVSSDPGTGASSSQAGSHFARLDCYHLSIYGNPYRLISPPFDLRSGDKQITFWGWVGPNSFTPQPLRIDISTDNQATWNNIYWIDSHSGEWVYHTISLAGFDYAGAAYISITGSSNYGINYCNLGVDSFEFGHTGSAMEIPEVSISELNGSIWLDWEPVAGANSYRIEASADPLTGYTELGSTSNTEYSDPATPKRFYRVFAID